MTPLIRCGDPIAVVAPCGIHDPARLERGLEIARARGHNLVLFPDLLRPHRYLASDDGHRVAQLTEALSSPEWAAVWITRGGYGLTRILERIDPARVRPKPIIGFSDLTALFCALQPHPVGPFIHGPVVHSLPVTDAGSVDALFDLLAGHPPPPFTGQTWVEGEATGPVWGGNLSLLAALCGTPWQLDARGAILMIEEVGEAPYRVDRLLQQLLSSGQFSGVTGIGVGQLDGCAPPDGAAWTMRELFVEMLAPLGVPIVGDLPFGHGASNRAFPLGGVGRIADGSISFSPVAPIARPGV
ncbi:MAG: LD-carboxypeptidase [Myxococcota bacterium]